MANDSDSGQPIHTNSKPSDNKGRSIFERIVVSLAGFQRVQIYLPYVFNQLGSLLFYFVLSRTDLSLAVPTCNALALVFSMLTSHWLGERVDKPLQTLTGACLIISGVTSCLLASSKASMAPKLDE